MGKRKEVKNIKKLAFRTKGADGAKKTVDYVEYMVIGNNHTWKDAMKLNMFKKLNPKVEI